jgi:hypothetical protein
VSGNRLGAQTASFEPRSNLRAWPSERGYQSQSARAAHQAWSETRRRALAMLAPLRPEDWRRAARHASRGPYAIGDMVREWADHDFSHRRQIAEALGEFA